MSANRCLVAPTLILLAVLQAVAFPQDASLDAVVQRLNSDSFHTRRAAADQLIKTGSEPGVQSERAVDALRRGLCSGAVEVRLACEEALLAISQANTDRQIEQLLNPHVDSAEIALSGWQQCSRFLGTDMAARKTFAAIHHNHPEYVRLLDRSVGPQQIQHQISRMDPYRLSPDDSVQWTLLLLLETMYGNDHPHGLTARSCMSLSSSHLGPKPQSTQESVVLKRIIDHWVVVHQDHCPTRECLLIAMRYDCLDRVKKICDSVFRDATEPPAAQVMAMLCASAIGISDCETAIRSRLNDQRTAHVWQLIASRKTKIRTQVSDVALALLLHHHGIDPRTVGFQELQADPMLIFQDHSLGFPDQSTRHSAHQQGLERLLSIDR